MTTYIIDIETLPAVEWDMERKAKYGLDNVPGRMSKPETISKWVEEEGQHLWRKTSFDPMHGFVCCVGIVDADGDLDPFVIMGDEPMGATLSEGQILGRLWHLLSAERGRPMLVAHNGNAFDYPFLRKRAMKRGHYDLARFLKPGKPWDSHLLDTYYAWSNGGKHQGGSMAALCEFFGIESDDQTTGADVFDLWSAGRYEEIGRHCEADVRKLRYLYHRLKHGDWL